MADADFNARLDAVIANHLPGCDGLIAVERLSGGASQETYRIRAKAGAGERLLAMRRAPGGLPPQPEATGVHPGLAVEARLMQAARSVGVPEPEVFHVLEEADGLGEGFLMEWLDGEALGARIVRSPAFEAVRPKLAFECGRILARIHAIDLQATGLDQALDTITPAEFLEQTWERYRQFPTPQPMIDYAGRWLMDHLPDTPPLTLVHNDFRNGNFMIDGQGIIAVLDWEVAHIGDPMRDLGWICTNSWRFGRSDLPVGGFGHYADLFAGYEAETGQPVDPERVRFWEVFGSYWWAIGCLGMAEHYRSGPDQTVERPAIGRRSSECQVDCVNLLIPGPAKLVQGQEPTAASEMPRLDELLISVRDYLRGDVMAETSGRTNFLARVAGNSLDIVLRDLELGAPHRDAEQARLRNLLGADESLETLRWRLVHALRDGSMPLDHPGLAAHLRETVVNQVAIDQPKYSGFKTAVGGT
ncbi:MAG: phosphotransferase [Gammaproteobacteria bacterium]|nr:phosphotransferase [Gammaproteobacteria bacterium]